MTIYQNENRAIKMYIYDKDKDAFECSGAYATVFDSDGEVVRAERACYVDDEAMWDLIKSDVTGTPGKYYVQWRVKKDEETYYHLTKIEVLGL